MYAMATSIKDTATSGEDRATVAPSYMAAY
jgi:hypothetical protein